ncbi:MAG: carbohydrate kinase family protein [Candidatus Woesebacteria bacterium]|nr:carbohydrate kinase family protein [Candidatus Woesebacteria bacterium]
MANFDLLSIGDANLDAFIVPSESETLCDIDTKKCFIAFSYADKIPVKNLEFAVGGNSANNAVGVKRLGVNVGSVLTLGDDSTGIQIIEKLKKENIDLTYVIQQPSTLSNFNVVVSYTGERTIFTYHAPRSYEFPVQLPKVPWVYLTSMGESYRPFYNHITEWLVKNPETKLAFNPGSWQLRGGTKEIGNVFKLSYIVFVNKQEAEKLTGHEAKSEVTKELLMALSGLGPKISVITDGGNGAYVFDGHRFLHCGVLPMDAYERTGAGDAFGSGFLSAIIKGKILEDALIWGTVNSASVIGYTGAQKGLLKEEDIDTWVERFKSSGVKVEEM